MESDDEPINIEAELMRQPWWFRLQWRFHEWRRQRWLSAHGQGEKVTP